MERTKRVSNVLWVMLFVVFSLMIPLDICLAANYPTKPIQVIVPYAPGGGADLVVRIFVDKLKDYIGQPVVVVNKPGGGAVLGAAFVAKAKPDGYTLLGCSQSSITLSPIIKKDEIDYKTEDFEPICSFDGTPVIFSVKKDAPWKTLSEFVVEAKKSPNKLTYSSSGTFTTTHIPVEVFAATAGIKMTHIPAAGSGPAVTALLGGHVQMCSSTLPSQLPQLLAGSIRALAQTDAKRIKELPETRTLIELGYNVKMIVWHGLLAPKGTPKEIVEKIYDSVKKMYESNKDALDNNMKKIGSTPSLVGLKEFERMIKEEYDAELEAYKMLGTGAK